MTHLKSVNQLTRRDPRYNDAFPDSWFSDELTGIVHQEHIDLVSGGPNETIEFDPNARFTEPGMRLHYLELQSRAEVGAFTRRRFEDAYKSGNEMEKAIEAMVDWDLKNE